MGNRNYFSRAVNHDKAVKVIERHKNINLQIVMGTRWLTWYLSGKKIYQIAKMAHKNPATIVKYMATAASQMVEGAHVDMLKELVPLARQVYVAKLKQDLADLAAGKAVNLADAERVLQGMSVFDSEQLKQGGTASADDSGNDGGPVPEIESFEMIRAKLKQNTKPVQQIAAAPEPTDTVEGTVVTDDQSKTDL